MMLAVFNGAVVAESDDVVVREGNHHFPPEPLHREYFGVSNRDAACHYPHPSPLTRKVKDRVAFWRGVQVGEADVVSGQLGEQRGPRPALRFIYVAGRRRVGG